MVFKPLIFNMYKYQSWLPIIFQVTGGNKGIGYAIVKGLCERYDGVVYLTARDEGRGRAAVKELNKVRFKAKHQTYYMAQNVWNKPSSCKLIIQVEINRKFLYLEECSFQLICNWIFIIFWNCYQNYFSRVLRKN